MVEEPYICEITEESACLKAYAVDPYDESKHVEGILVTFRNSKTGEIIYTGVTNTDGYVR